MILNYRVTGVGVHLTVSTQRALATRVANGTRETALYQKKRGTGGRCGARPDPLRTTPRPLHNNLGFSRAHDNHGERWSVQANRSASSRPRRGAFANRPTASNHHQQHNIHQCCPACVSDHAPRARMRLAAFSPSIPPRSSKGQCVLSNASSHTLQVEESLTTPCGARLHPQTTQRTLALPTPEGMIVRPAPCRPRGGHSAAAWPL